MSEGEDNQELDDDDDLDPAEIEARRAAYRAKQQAIEAVWIFYPKYCHGPREDFLHKSHRHGCACQPVFKTCASDTFRRWSAIKMATISMIATERSSISSAIALALCAIRPPRTNRWNKSEELYKDQGKMTIFGAPLPI